MTPMAVGGRARLADVAHLREHRAVDGLVEVGVVGDVDRVLATELHAEGDQARCRGLGDAAAGPHAGADGAGTPIGMDDDFFAAGGHSLALLQLRDELARRTGRVVDAEEAVRVGLATRAYAADALQDEVLAIADDTCGPHDADGVARYLERHLTLDCHP